MPSSEKPVRHRPPARAVVVSVRPPELSEHEAQISRAELEHLLGGLGIHVVGDVAQARASVDAPTFVGAGKLRELASFTGGTGAIHRGPMDLNPTRMAVAAANLVVADAELSPGQHRALEIACGVPVLDRVDVVLRLFEGRARTPEARLELELARLSHELPRIRDDASLGDREGGGGRAARGHTNVELAKQRGRDRMAALRRELAALRARARAGRERRAEVPTVALAGYTNAGKSSLMRLLTGSDVLVADRLFATLGPTVRQLAPPSTPRILVADTVGFMRRLPHALLASFRSTLDEVRDASLLLVVADAADPSFRAQLQVTRGVLAEVHDGQPTTWIVLNKMDRVSADARIALATEFPEALQICAHEAADGARLRDAIVTHFERRLVTQTIELPYERRAVLSQMHEHVRIVSERYGPTITAEVRGTPETLARLRKRLTVSR